MYSQIAKTLIDIAVGHLLPNKYAWVSEYEAGPFHVETTASASKGGDTFNALCGAFGSFMAHRTAKQVLSSEKCQTCKELSTTGIQDVADRGMGAAPQLESSQVGDTRSECSLYQALNTEDGVSGSTEGRADEHKSDGQGEGRRQVEDRKGIRFDLRDESGPANLSPKHYQLQVPTTGNQAPDADSRISLIERLIPKTLPDADFCHCGQPAVHTCPCQAKVCVAHLYDGEGQHVEAQGFCSACVDLISAQNQFTDPQYERNGR